MYTKLPYSIKKYDTKVQAIRHIKAHHSKRYRARHNNTETVKYVLNRHTYYAASKAAEGIYVPSNLRYGELLNASNDFYRETEDYFDFTSGNSYGVCDGVSNFREVFDKELSSIEEKVCVVLTPMYKDQQPECGGWRWHKWGPYIGNHEQTTEYLYDEKLIDEVWVYHIYVVTDKVKHPW